MNASCGVSVWTASATLPVTVAAVQSTHELAPQSSSTDRMDPALQNILATLAQYGPPAQAVGSVEYNNRTSTPTTAFSAVQNAPIDRPHSTAVDAHPKPQTRSTASPQPVIDPATITTWQDGLRCVTKLAAQNAAFASSIRRVSLDPCQTLIV